MIWDPPIRGSDVWPRSSLGGLYLPVSGCADGGAALQAGGGAAAGAELRPRRDQSLWLRPPPLAAPGPEGCAVQRPVGGAARLAAQNPQTERPTGPAAAAAAGGGEAAERTPRRRRSARPGPAQQTGRVRTCSGYRPGQNWVRTRGDNIPDQTSASSRTSRLTLTFNMAAPLIYSSSCNASKIRVMCRAGNSTLKIPPMFV